MDAQQPPPLVIRKPKWPSATLKVLTIGLLVFLLLIPMEMVRSLIWEREKRRSDVVKELSAKWGDSQVLVGPILTLPFGTTVPGPAGKAVPATHYLQVLPQSLDVAGAVTPEIRYRGIFEVALYNTKLRMTGVFARPDFKALGVSERDIRWDRAAIGFGITDIRGLRSDIRLTVGGHELAMNPGLPTDYPFPTGLSAIVPTARAAQELPFELDLDLNGSLQLAFAPVGKTTTVELTSPWTSPSFDGAFLPEARDVGPDGFTARWKVLHLNRDFPQAWIGSRYRPADSAFGVKMFIPADAYQKTTRTAKYALMFIGLTFLAFFISEVMNRLTIHPVQYALVGAGLVIFYSLLLSLSEQLSFGAGYVISAAATILLVAGYARAVLRKRSLSVMVGSLLAVLYAYLYIVLQMEDYALLLGSVGLFVILALVMYLTRRVNWYTVGSPEPGK